MGSVTVTATRWELGWELELDDGGVTQVRSLGSAVRQVRDFLDTVAPDVDHSLWEVVVVPDIGPAYGEALAAKVATDEARAVTVAAARRMRQAVRGLLDAGLSATDTAVVLGVTKARVSQLVR